jgi:8-oxo-dGTP pyrophosphatase MutT (NUDIX family)
MGYSHLLLHRTALGDEEVLLAQRNIFLPPTDQYPFAAIARNATQYILPGGKAAPGESPLDAAVRELLEDTGALVLAKVRPLCVIGDRSFFEATAPTLELGRINAALAQGTARSAKTNNLTWVALDAAESWMGMKVEYQHLPWVTAQITRAVKVGFAREHIAPRVNDPHAAFVQAINTMRGLGGTIGLEAVDPNEGQ